MALRYQGSGVCPMSSEKGPILVALVGVGNCASALVQGCQYYSGSGRERPGLLTPSFAGYRPEHLSFVAAYDIDERKTGRDLSEAIFAEPNCTARFIDEVQMMDCEVRPGFEIDSVGVMPADAPAERRILPARGCYSDAGHAKSSIVSDLRQAGAEILVNYLPVGSDRNARFYAECALEAGCGFVNAMPALMVTDLGPRFMAARLPYLGDDVKSQVGATILHRALVSLFRDRGMPIRRSYQLNVGGNTDFLNMLDRERLNSKRISKTEAVRSQMDLAHLDRDGLYIGPSDYVPWLDDRKICFLRIEAEQFGGVPMDLELRLSVEDSPNSAGVMLDAIRAARVALDRGLAGPVAEVCAYLFKSPPVQYEESSARELLRRFATGS